METRGGEWIMTTVPKKTNGETDLGTKMNAMAVVGSVILTYAATIASWPASAFLLMNYADPQDTGALIAGSLFLFLAIVLWGSAFSGWFKVYKTKKS